MQIFITLKIISLISFFIALFTVGCGWSVMISQNKFNKTEFYCGIAIVALSPILMPYVLYKAIRGEYKPN